VQITQNVEQLLQNKTKRIRINVTVTRAQQVLK